MVPEPFCSRMDKNKETVDNLWFPASRIQSLVGEMSLLSAAVGILGLIFYLIFGQAEVQDWAKCRHAPA